MTKIFVFILLLASKLIFGKQQPDFVFQNVNIVSMQDKTVLKQQNLAVLNGEIVEISPKKIKAKTVIDLGGKYIMPSLADAHVHFPEKEEDLDNFIAKDFVQAFIKN